MSSTKIDECVLRVIQCDWCTFWIASVVVVVEKSEARFTIITHHHTQQHAGWKNNPIEFPSYLFIEDDQKQKNNEKLDRETVNTTSLHLFSSKKIRASFLWNSIHIAHFIFIQPQDWIEFFFFPKIEIESHIASTVPASYCCVSIFF